MKLGKIEHVSEPTEYLSSKRKHFVQVSEINSNKSKQNEVEIQNVNRSAETIKSHFFVLLKIFWRTY